jgi:phosphoglycerate dehydrogenase-like enzyme
MKKAKVAFITHYPEEEIRLMMEVAPPELSVYYVDGHLPDETKISMVRDADFILPFPPGQLSVDVAKACPNLKLVQLVAAGWDQIDVKTISGVLGIPVAHNGGSNSTAVAEFAVTLMLNVYKRFIPLVKTLADGKWVTNLWTSSYDLEGKTVGIVGLGRVGKKVAARIGGFNVKLIGWDILDIPEATLKELCIQKKSFETLLRESDIVTLHVPLTPDTRGFVGKKELALMKSNAVLINTSRGPIVDEAALYEALRDKKIAGAGLDVLQQEPMTPDNPLKNLENVIITAHAASNTLDSRRNCASFAFANMMRVLHGEKPIAVIET